MYAVASPDPNPGGGGQLPNPNECNSTLTSKTRDINLIWRNRYPVQKSNFKCSGFRTLCKFEIESS